MSDTNAAPDLNRRILPPFLVPGAAYYVTGEDKLRIAVANTLAGVTLSARGRFCQLNGTITPFVVDFTPASDGSTGNTDILLGEGWLLNVEVIVTAGAPTSVQTFVTMLLVRGDSAAAFEIAVINQGFATASNRVFWPWSQQVVGSVATRDTVPKLITGTVPAAGADIVDVVPAGKYWRLLGLVGKFTSDGNAANRQPKWLITTSTDKTVWSNSGEFNLTAAQARIFVASNTTYNQTGPDAVLATIRQPLANLWLPAGAKIKSSTLAIQVGDQWSDIFYNVEETTA